jgi:hypothetical protein
VNVLVGGPRVADQNSFAGHWRVDGEDWQMFWREGQGWQIKTVLQVIGESKEKIGECSGGRAKVGRSVSHWQVEREVGECSDRRAKGGRSRQFCKSLVSQRRRLVNVLVGRPRLAEQDSLEVFG